MVGGSRCFKGVMTGHFNRECTVTTTTQVSDLIFFHCNQRGHKKANCPILAVGGPVVAPSLTTLQITDGHQGKDEVHVARSRAFQLTTEEACATLDVVTGMYLILIYLFMMIFLLIYVLDF